MLNDPRCQLATLKRFPDSSRFLSMLETSTLVRENSQPLARLLKTHYYSAVCGASGALKLDNLGSKSKSEDVAGRRGRKACWKAWSEGVAGRRGRKTWSEGVVGRRGRKAWPEGVAGRRGRKAWPEGVAGKLAHFQESRRTSHLLTSSSISNGPV